MFNFGAIGKSISEKAPNMLRVGGKEGANISKTRLAVAGAAAYGTVAAGENLFSTNKNQ